MTSQQQVAPPMAHKTFLGSIQKTLALGWKAYRGDGTASLCLFILFTLIICAIAAPLIAPQNPFNLAEIDLADARLAPLSASLVDGPFHLLGTDAQGRDLFSVILYGLRTSLMVAIASSVGALALGCTAGLTAAYFGGWIEAVIMRIVVIFLSLPAIFIALLSISLLGRGAENTILAILIVQWTHYARASRAAAAGELTKEYILAAQLMKLPRTRILVGHVLPNCLAPIFVILAVQLGYVIAIEASLSYLGLGLPITQPSLGSLVADGQAYLLSGAYWISLIPGFVLLILVFCANLVGDRIRLLMNPSLRRA